ncbi:hypothetical protein BGZ99_003576 [Dissophora globulifera]|uniref:Uncharacterized protein n=1 Tax=Dissophora globulifera TaxID=979702 RepID=A0A9P6RNZ9_9FUNG|nr:hypothetical protein BGZ99_003576 [Dissophora globulifera]
MSSFSPIATAIGMDEVVGAVLTGASIVLTTHSLSRMVFLRRSGSKYHLFPIINVAQLINQFCIFFLITVAFGTVSFHEGLWLNVINNFAYFITKPITMYLAYLRCSAVYPEFRKLDWFHWFMIAFRAIELFAIVVINIIQNYLCDGSVAKGTRCANLAIAWTFRDAGAPVFRLYYIVCEGIFYAKLFKTLKGMSQGKNVPLIQYRRLQTSLFTVDLLLLIFMSIYRIIGIFDKTLPTYVYYELFSSTLTIFNLTEFGLNIRTLFNTVVTESNSRSDGASESHNKMEMGSIPPTSHRTSTTNSSGVNGRLGSHPSTTKSVDFDLNSNGHQQIKKHSSSSTSPLTSFAAETGYASGYGHANNNNASALSSYQQHHSSYQSPLGGINSHDAETINALNADYDNFIPYNSFNSPSLQHMSSVLSSTTPSLNPAHQERHIIPPARLQDQVHSTFYEDMTASALAATTQATAATVINPQDDRLSRPSRALVPPPRSVARR